MYEVRLINSRYICLLFHGINSKANNVLKYLYLRDREYCRGACIKEQSLDESLRDSQTTIVPFVDQFKRLVELMMKDSALHIMKQS